MGDSRARPGMGGGGDKASPWEEEEHEAGEARR